MTEPHWLSLRAVLLIHSSSLAELAAATEFVIIQRWIPRLRDLVIGLSMNPMCHLADLAASYGFGLTRNHPFRDGNKRISFAAAATFVHLNGYRLTIEDRVDAIHTVVELGA